MSVGRPRRDTPGVGRRGLLVGESVRWAPLTTVLLLVSTWWVKWPLICAIGWAGDCSRRRLTPRAAAAGLAAVGVAALFVTAFKELFDRARPPIANPTLEVVGSLPASASFPSGHAATAFAAAVAVGMIHPRLRRPLLALAGARCGVARLSRSPLRHGRARGKRARSAPRLCGRLDGPSGRTSAHSTRAESRPALNELCSSP